MVALLEVKVTIKVASLVIVDSDIGSGRSDRYDRLDPIVVGRSGGIVVPYRIGKQ